MTLSPYTASPRTAPGLPALTGLTTLSAALFALGGCASSHTPAGGSASLQGAALALDAAPTQSIEFSGTGRWYQFGQAPAPGQAWPPFDVSRYAAQISYAEPAARVQIVRKQVVEPGRERPAPVEQSADQWVRGTQAWNLNPVAAPQAGSPALSTPVAQPGAVEERRAEIWSTPHGFLKAALAHQASSRAVAGGGVEVSFALDGKTRVIGLVNARQDVERVQTWIDTPVLGDTLVETRYTDYKDFGGVRFPAHIVRLQGGHPVLDLQVSAVSRNPVVDLQVPAVVANAPTPAVEVTSELLAPGVVYLKGGTHHSVLIEQRDHLVLVEGPLNEARSIALLDHLKTTYPNKPLRYVINTHVHFDHSGGLRTFVDAGAIIVTHQGNRAYYEQAWAAPHTLNPDRLEKSRKPARFETFTSRHVLSDGQRQIEIHPLSGNGHNDAFAVVYLPAEKVLVEADAYTPAAANAPPPAKPNPYSVNLHEQIRQLKLDVAQIAALHGPRVTTPADLRAAIGLTTRP